MYSKLFLVSAAIMATVSANMMAPPKVNCKYVERTFAMYHSPRSMECCKTGKMMGKKDDCKKNMARSRGHVAKMAKKAGCKMPSVNTALCRPKNQEFLDKMLAGSCPGVVSRRPKNPDGPGCNKAEWEKEQQREGPDKETKKVMMWCIKTQSCAEHVQKAYMRAHHKPKHHAKKAHHGKHAKAAHHAKKAPQCPKGERMVNQQYNMSNGGADCGCVPFPNACEKNMGPKGPSCIADKRCDHIKAAANGPKLPKIVLECLKKTNTHWPEKHCDMVTAQSAMYNSRATFQLCLKGKMGPNPSEATCKKEVAGANVMVEKLAAKGKCPPMVTQELAEKEYKCFIDAQVRGMSKASGPPPKN